MNKQIVLGIVLGVLLAASAYAQTTDLFELVATCKPQDMQAAINNGADVNVRDLSGNTPLMAACYAQCIEVVPILLNAGVDINAQDAFGHTALMLAAIYYEGPDIITALIDAGADAKVKDKKGNTVFDYAKENWRLKDTEIYRRLQEALE